FYGKQLARDDQFIRMITSWCRRIAAADHDRIWVGAANGLYLIRENEILSHLLPDESIQDILNVPDENAVYCSTLSGKIYLIRNGQTELFRKPSEQGTQVYRMKWRQGQLWLATSKGLGKINTKSRSEDWFNTNDGLSANVIYDLYFQGNSLWLATGNGLQKVPAGLKKNDVTPRLYLQHISVNETPTDTASLSFITSDELSLAFSVISYYSQGNYTLSYSFNNQKWTHLQKGQNTFSLNNIPADSRGIWVRAIDSKGQSSPSVFLRWKVSPPYWQSTWFYLLIILFSVGLMTGLFLIYLRQVRKKQESALEKAELKTNLIESQLTALKAQMNPHFIFNALNSIYELIVFSETKEAATYLNKFATLLRKVLENSEKEAISLHEESEWLALYLELEKLRFGSDFSYQISMAKVLDPYNITVPTMLLQPFVENAVKHGLLHKSGIKRLEIEFSEADGSLKCVIRDNGVGRKKAEDYRRARPGKHRSFATGAINRRIGMLNDSGKFSIQLFIDDLEFPNGKAAGTEVTLIIQGW
ncbi:MAG: histidine kinase, partial [Bacteroidota bacterium]|nr:histidine kinase [Bacteroidota bacterium]MDX5431856.1 histidine kinase [Bacteroidota bacterium]MDX5470567.1 histidine kinase [Bacteroidota bacterium]